MELNNALPVRQSAVAGYFYPEDPAELASTVTGLLADARTRSPVEPRDMAPKALIVPHAGYVYSGPTAALAYLHLGRASATIRRVVLLGPVHRVPVRGLALPGAAAFATPLGEVPVDLDGARALSRLRQVVTSAAAHALEHSLEVHLPFLQTVLRDFTILPLAVGDATPEDVAEVIEAAWGGPDTVVVISSDLSHYLAYAQARAVDTETIARILALDGPLTHHQACGATPVNGLLVAARRRDLRPHLLEACNSGDTAGDKRRVVGYAAIAFTEQAS